MSIQRRYSLPNCTLMLEGWSSEATALNPADTVMTLLTRAECRFTDYSEPLSGEREFLESLVNAVSAYAQQCLSGLSHSQNGGERPGVVHFDPIPEKHRHRLTFIPPQATHGPADSATMSRIQIDLTSVQLFDLVEAVDQFLSDSNTLPEFTLQLQPLPRSARKPDQPLATRATPVALGVTSLAAAAAALFFVPVPEVRAPQTSRPEETRLDETSDPSATSTLPVGIESTLATAPTLTNPEQLAILAQDLEANLNAAWNQPESVSNLLEYRVWVTEAGEVLGYQSLGESDRALSEAPVLPELLTLRNREDPTTPTPVAQLRVVFNENGVVEVSPLEAQQ